MADVIPVVTFQKVGAANQPNFGIRFDSDY